MSKKQIGKFLLSVGGKGKHLTICVHIIKHRKVNHTSKESKIKVLLIEQHIVAIWGGEAFEETNLNVNNERITSRHLSP